MTGCCGFIGGTVGKQLLLQGHEVIGLDNLNDAYDVRLKNWRLKILENMNNFTFKHLDISNYKDLETFWKEEGPFRTVINLAARAGVRYSIEDPWKYFETNVIGTLNLLECCRDVDESKFILASSSSVYGDGVRPFKENQLTDRPLSPYAASKKAAEALCHSYHFLYGIDMSILRYFTVYGEAGRPDMSVFRFIKWIAEGEPVLIYGDGTQKREFTYVGDISNGTISALKPLGFEIINLGGGHSVSLKTIIKIIEQLLNKKAKIKYLPRHPADISATSADISKAKALLDWTPKTNLKEGLSKTVEWYLRNRRWIKEVKMI